VHWRQYGHSGEEQSPVPTTNGIPDCPASSIVTILTTVSLVLRGTLLFVLFTDVSVIKCPA